MIPADLHPDQQPEQWDDHVSVYEAAFEPFTMEFANAAIARLNLERGQSVLDVGAGSGGAALALAAAGLRVTAVDASQRMVERVRARANAQGLALDARVMDGQALALADASFDTALSVLGVILFPEAGRGLVEMRRVVRTGGNVSVVTWTQPERYELAVELRRAIQSVWPEQPAAPLPPQLRYQDAADLQALFRAAGFAEVSIDTVTAALEAPSARWLAERIGFAPGMTALLDSLDDRRAAILATFISNLEAKQGTGKIQLGGVAFVATARVP